MSKNTKLIAVTIVASAALVACGGGSSDTPAPTPSNYSVNIVPTAVAAYWGHTSALQALVKNEAGQVLSGQTVMWSSADDIVASVSGSGVVTHNAPGLTTVVAAHNSAQGVASAKAEIKTMGFAAQTLRVQDKDNCALSEDGKDVWCWGDGYALWSNRTDYQLLEYVNPVRINKGAIPADASIVSLAPGFKFSCATTTADVYCWQGALTDIEAVNLGTGLAKPYNLPQKVLAGEIPVGVGIKQVKASDYSTACGLGNDGELYCWGESDRLMDAANPSADRVNAPWRVAKGAAASLAFVDFAFGTDFNCAIAGGRPYCATSRPGNTFALMGTSDAPATVKFVKIKSEAGAGNFMGLLGDDGWAYTMGTGFGRRFGNGGTAFVSGTDANKVRPIGRGAIPAGAKIVDIAVGGIAASSCVVADNGKAYCWGAGFNGSLGDGILAPHDALLPVEVLQGEVPAGVKFVSIECGTYHCTAMGSNGLPYAWGYAEGAGNGQVTSSAAPRLVSKVELR